ncbi:glycosyltransferase family 2 protein [Konateibacter massiliensis]|uniref:glycosyltransferase family 2 protein n=1 Tax=Konateibacter massiliensis TaxID=2002841 RepID=UPI000C14F23F|nr:glycosyltransferase family 2 protein [Konateibacter massiliensis]
MSKLSIIVPVYYNADTIMLLYEDLKAKILEKLGDYEIVFVDDGSEDNSWDVMNQIKALDDNVKLVKLSKNYGEHAAVLAGLMNCSGDCAVVKQADLVEPAELILEMKESWEKGNKVVLAVRADRDDGLMEKIFANLYYAIVRKFIMSSMPKGGFDCYLIDRQVIEVLRMLDEKNSALTLQVLWVGFKRDMIYFHRGAREIGESKWTLSKKVKLVLDSMMSFSYFPVRFMSGVGVLFFGASVIWALVIVFQRFFTDVDVEGWTSLMAMLLCSSGLIMLMLGIIGEYIWRALDASRNRPPYIVDEIVEKDSKEHES